MENFKSENISCKPIDTLDELLIFKPEKSKQYNVTQLKLLKSEYDKQILVCHDMKNNYLEDKYFQGSNESNSFEFFHWQYIDIFIYFSHHFITIPPETWINAAHENNCRILGTFITEWKEGKLICDQILNSDQMINKVVDQLVQLTLFYKFDGWLINIENPINNVPRLISLVEKLTQKLKKINSSLYKIIWYDSVIKTGELKWQNELNEKNDCFFNVCDGIFINYTWDEGNLKQCQTYKERLKDIFIGVDVFGRGCLGGGGFNTKIAVEKLNEFNLSCALFAPGWLHENNPTEELITNSQLFWESFGDYVSQRVITHLPLVTTFSHSRSKKFYLNGDLVSNDWSNLSLQTCLPILTNWCFDDAFYAGSSALLKSNETVNLFSFNITDLKSNLIVEYAFKQETNGSFYLTLIHDSNQLFDLKELNQNDHLKIVKSSKTINKNKWRLVKFEIELVNKISLKGLNVVCLSEPARLGYLRVFEPHVSVEVNKPISDVSISEKKFKLNGQVYMCIHLKWSMCSSKYLNVFIESNRLKYVGSTRSDHFMLCLKLNTSQQCINDCFKLKLLHVDDMFTSVLKPVFHDVEINGAKFESDLDYDVIYDFELF